MRRLGWMGWVVVLCLGACSSKKAALAPPPPDAGPVRMAEREPNDTPEQAQPLSASTEVTGALSADPTHPDEDWYVLMSSTPRWVDLSLSAVPSLEMALEIYDSDKARIATANRFPNLGVRGQLFVKVFSKSRGAGGAYTLTALFTEPRPGFESEPNDRAADATPLHEGELVANGWQVSGYVGHAADEDWYRINLREAVDAGTPEPDAGADGGAADGGSLPVGGVDGGSAEVGDGGLPAPAPVAEPREALRIELSAVPGVRPELQLLSAAQGVLFTAVGKAGEPLSLRNVGVRATDPFIYATVRGAVTGTGKEAKRGYNPADPYTLTVSREVAGSNAELEPNDDFEHATPLLSPGHREGFISPRTDVDYYVVRPGQPSLVNVQLSGVEHVDLVLTAVQPPGKPSQAEGVLKRANDGAVKEPEYLNNIACAAECYFKVEGALKKEGGKWQRSYENSIQAYEISVTSAPDDGALEREPNDSVETATPLVLGKPIRGTIQPRKDDDFYRLDLSARPVKTSLKATVTAILKVDIGLYLWKETSAGKELVQTVDHGRKDALRVVRYSAEPGVYFLEVRDVKNRESNFQDSYQLTVEESP